MSIEFGLNNFTSYIVGINHINEDGLNRAQIIRDYLAKKVDDKHLYSGYTDDDILSENFYYSDKIFKYHLEEISSVDFKVEKDNPFDDNPIKVYHKCIGDLGYIPSIHKEIVKYMIENQRLVYIELRFEGGEYKTLSNDKKNVEEGSCPIELILSIYYRW